MVTSVRRRTVIGRKRGGFWVPASQVQQAQGGKNDRLLQAQAASINSRASLKVVWHPFPAIHIS